MGSRNAPSYGHSSQFEKSLCLAGFFLATLGTPSRSVYGGVASRFQKERGWLQPSLTGRSVHRTQRQGRETWEPRRKMHKSCQNCAQPTISQGGRFTEATQTGLWTTESISGGRHTQYAHKGSSQNLRLLIHASLGYEMHFYNWSSKPLCLRNMGP